MISDKKRVTVMLHDRVTPRLIELAAAMKIPTNELANRFIEGCIQQIDQKRRLLDPSPIVELVRKTLSLDLSRGDRFIQRQLQKYIPGWDAGPARWKELVLEEIDLMNDLELTEGTTKAARKRADKRWKEEKRMVSQLANIPPKDGD